jgi:hypothetical protein
VCLGDAAVQPGHQLLGVFIVSAGADESVVRQMAFVPGQDFFAVLLQSLPCLPALRRHFLGRVSQFDQRSQRLVGSGASPALRYVGDRLAEFAVGG